MAKFIVMNDLPLPGLYEVNIMTWLVPSLHINSTLVRITRNASFMVLREPAFTTISANFVLVSKSSFFFPKSPLNIKLFR